MHRTLPRIALFSLFVWPMACQPPGDADAVAADAEGEPNAGGFLAQSARVPRITAVNPPLCSNQGGVQLTLTGTSFQPGTQVYIGGQPALATYYQSSTRLTAHLGSKPMPVGPVTLRIVNPDGRQSERSDLLKTFNDNVSFVPLRSTLPINGNGQSFTVADLNGDGRQDFILTDYFSGLRTLLTRGRGEYVEGQMLMSSGGMPPMIRVGDFNGDGKPDLLFVSSYKPQVDVYLNRGDGTFGTPVSSDLAAASGYYGASGYYVADINHDGRADLVASYPYVSPFYSPAIVTYLGQADGKLVAGPTSGLMTLTQPLDSRTLAVDVNGDGNVDLLAAGSGSEVLFLAGSSDGTFAAPAASAVDSRPQQILSGDFNGDGKVDLATLGSDNKLSIRIGNGDGTFGGTTLITVNQDARTIALGDINGDGKLDLLVGSAQTNTGSTVTPGGVFLHSGNGDGTFQMPRALDLAPLQSAYDLRVADVDKDGKLDVVVSGDIGTIVLYGRGGGNFFEDIKLPAAATALTHGDVNGDGKADVVAVSASTNKLYVMLGLGDGTLAAPRTYDTDRGPSAVALADVNGDGKADLLVTNYDAATVSLLPGNGDGSYSPQRIFGVGTGANALVVTDLNGDAKLDIATANYEANSVSVLLNSGAGGFNAAKNYSTGAGPTALAVGDFNGDGRPDLVTANADANSLSYLQASSLSAGVFNTAKSLPAGKTPSAILARDINGDGKLDIVTGNTDSSELNLNTGKGDGTFNTASVLAPVGSVSELLSTDFNGDGRVDLVISGGNSGSVTLLYNLPGGVYSPAARTPQVGGPLAAPDLNGDGKPDLIIGQLNGALPIHFNNQK